MPGVVNPSSGGKTHWVLAVQEALNEALALRLWQQDNTNLSKMIPEYFTNDNISSDDDIDSDSDIDTQSAQPLVMEAYAIQWWWWAWYAWIGKLG